MGLRHSEDKDGASIDVKDVEATHVEAAGGAARVLEIGTFRVTGLSTEDAEFFQAFPEEKIRKVFRKVRKEDFFCLALLLRATKVIGGKDC